MDKFRQSQDKEILNTGVKVDFNKAYDGADLDHLLAMIKMQIALEKGKNDAKS
jgi:hypothetical protein